MFEKATACGEWDNYSPVRVPSGIGPLRGEAAARMLMRKLIV